MRPEIIINRTLLVVCCLMLAGIKTVNAQAPAAQPPAKDSAGEQNVEVLLNTMNEVLEENRKIREQLKNNEDALQKMASENTTLRGQLRKMKDTEQAGVREDKDKIEKLESSLADLEKSVKDMTEQNKQLTQIKTYHEQKIPELERETRELKTLLDSAILEGEREEYLQLIQNAQNMTLRSLEELKVNKQKTLQMNEDMAEAEYKLGNLLYDMKDFQNAIASYEKALRARPNDPWIHYNLGVIYDYYIHDLQKALYHYRQYLQFKPYDEEANEIRERILDAELKKNMIPDGPLRDEFNKNEVKVPR